MKQILGFNGEHSFLSNFHPSPVVVDGKEYPTVEHAFQAMKTDDPIQQEHVRTRPTPGSAKYAGRRVTLRQDWEYVKLSIMHYLVQQKFSTNPDLRDRLLATGNAYLEETNIWNDHFWGVSRGKGENHLGKILMLVRVELAYDVAVARCQELIDNEIARGLDLGEAQELATLEPTFNDNEGPSMSSILGYFARQAVRSQRGVVQHD